MSVRNSDGLIGRVLETGRWAARILLVTDGASNVPVRSTRDGTPALAVGRGDGTIELRTLEVGQNPFRRGDVLVTSGSGGLFPPNILQFVEAIATIAVLVYDRLGTNTTRAGQILVTSGFQDVSVIDGGLKAYRDWQKTR